MECGVIGHTRSTNFTIAGIRRVRAVIMMLHVLIGEKAVKRHRGDNGCCRVRSRCVLQAFLEIGIVMQDVDRYRNCSVYGGVVRITRVSVTSAQEAIVTDSFIVSVHHSCRRVAQFLSVTLLHQQAFEFAVGA